MEKVVKRNLNVAGVLKRICAGWASPVLVVVILLAAVVTVNPGAMYCSLSTFLLMEGEEQIVFANVDAIAMHSEFGCSCCGKNIGDCDCGMARERKVCLELYRH